MVENGHYLNHETLSVYEKAIIYSGWVLSFNPKYSIHIAYHTFLS